MPLNTALFTVAEIRDIEQRAAGSLPPGTLMQRAGTAAAASALRILPDAKNHANVLILAGPGNNGGDALVTARMLKEAGVQVTALMVDSLQRPPDAQEALVRAISRGVRIEGAVPESVDRNRKWDLVVDGLFGIGLKRQISGTARSLIEAVNALDCPVLALDIPSGLDADTGCVVGDDGIAIRATRTVTFIADKPGLHTCDGHDFAGEVHVADLDIEQSRFTPSTAELNSVEAFAPFLRKRRHNSHKGSYGDVIVIGGAPGMCGAPILSARAAAHCGAGRVYAVFLDLAPPYDSQHPELMFRRVQDMNLSSGTLVIGPGLGTSRAAHEVLDKVLHTQSPLVLDADALNLVAAESGLRQILSRRAAPTVLTPHPLEAARLLETSAKQIQGDRPAAARLLADQLQAIVILKGSGSVIATPEGRIAINTTGNPALATAGTGDVLAGMCGALLAQHFPPRQAAMAASWLHGKAADLLVEQGTGPIGLTASELIPCARMLLNRLTDSRGAY